MILLTNSRYYTPKPYNRSEPFPYKPTHHVVTTINHCLPALFLTSNSGKRAQLFVFVDVHAEFAFRKPEDKKSLSLKTKWRERALYINQLQCQPVPSGNGNIDSWFGQNLYIIFKKATELLQAQYHLDHVNVFTFRSLCPFRKILY